MRKITIPYGNFMSNSQISAKQMNLNFDEIEYVFNDLFEDYVEYKKFIETEYAGGLSIETLDELIGEYALMDYTTGYASNDEIIDILCNTEYPGVFGEIVADSIRACFITKEEIETIVRSDIHNV